MTDADTYFEGEIDTFRVAHFEALAAKRHKEKTEAEARARRLLRGIHTIELDDDYSGRDVRVCLLDVPAEDLRKALDAHGDLDEYGPLSSSVLRSARSLYLVGRKVEFAEAIYPAIRDALGVAL